VLAKRNEDCLFRFVKLYFILDKASSKTPTDTIPFGISPLIWEAAYKALPKLPGASLRGSRDYDTQDIASDTQWFFALITP
jgi:hypothetical protein